MSRPEREFPRYAHEAAITLNIADRVLSGRTTNLSRGGVCATMPEPLAVGTDTEVDIQLVFEEGVQSEPLRVPARIVWCTPVNDGFQVGVRFLRIDAERAEYLTMFLRYLDDTTGAKGAEPALSIDERFG
ncbi:MAG TPA: PilZ domain-containing protein [Kofleriaceae bacterium]|nr:PilZ domain-containing protein [Kofleriaceae bacterium]